MRAFVSLTAAVVLAIGIALGMLAGTGSVHSGTSPQSVLEPELPDAGSQMLLAGSAAGGPYWSPAFSCNRPPFPPSDDYVRLATGRTEWLLSVPNGAEIDPGFVATNHLIAYEAVCYGPNVPGAFQGADPTQVRIAWQDPKTGIWRMGPVVMAFAGASDLNLATSYGSDSLWLYAPGWKSASLTLRVSGATGKVIQVVPTPFVDRPVAFTTSRGLWLYSRDPGVDTTRITVTHVSANSQSVTELPNRPLIDGIPVVPGS